MTRVTCALLLTAGFGTRLRPLTDVRAKPAIPVAGVPMVSRIIRWLAGQAITDIVMNLHARPESLASVVGDGSQFGVRARYSWEQPVVLGSAGGPRQALDVIGADTFLIVNGDTLTDLPIGPLVAAHQASDALVTMAVVPNRRPDHYSGLRLSPDGAVLGVEPRGSSTPSFHFIGVQVAHRDAFAALPAGTHRNSVGDVYTELIAARAGSVRAVVGDARFFDIGTVSDYRATCRTFAHEEQYDETGRIRLGAGAHVEDSIAWDDVSVGDRTRVTDCILTDGVALPADSSYTGKILMASDEGITIVTA